ncbi:MAG TPA: hypothetical protein VFT90_14950 [Chryseosolibacter sp.]|nr:hypothetical protein [Chryseosolibacter sp.]
MKNALPFLIVTCLLFCCEHENINIEVNESIAGSWLYVEYGYSPGDKYHTVPVSAIPPQTITFNSDFSMTSTIQEMETYKYYRLLEDTVVDRQVIAFFKENPGNEPLDLAALSPTYFTYWQGSDLYLNYRWCIEGCHMKFKRISSAETE